MDIKVYGIPNCGSVKKAKDWLSQHEIKFTFHDYKKTLIDKESLKRWCKEFGWEKLVNKKGLTWKALPDEVKLKITNDETAIDLMLANNSIIKRPVIESS